MGCIFCLLLMSAENAGNSSADTETRIGVWQTRGNQFSGCFEVARQPGRLSALTGREAYLTEISCVIRVRDTSSRCNENVCAFEGMQPRFYCDFYLRSVLLDATPERFAAVTRAHSR